MDKLIRNPPDLSVGRLKLVSTLTEEKVIQILDLLKQSVPHRAIAEDFGVSKKTISRINTGETWKDVSMRYNQRKLSAHIRLPSLNITTIAPEIADLIDEITAVKNNFGFDFKQPLYWGWFDAWDGVHSVVSDGYIIWESADLVKYANRLADTNVEESPVYASRAEELPTFELEDIMTLPIGDKYTIDATAGDVVRLTGHKGSIFIRSKYVNIATRLKLDIRMAGKDGNYVYLTKNKPKSPNDPTPIVIACVVTLKESTK